MFFLVIGIAVVIAIIVIVTVSSKNLKDWKNLVEAKEIDTLYFGEVISFFKQSDINTKLKENEKYIAVTIKEKKDNNTKIIACIFDQEKNNIADIKYATAWNAKSIDNDLLEAFGEKDMIILQ